MKKDTTRAKRAPRGRGNLLAACVLGGLATLSTFSCSHNSESQGPNAPSGTAGDNTSMGTGGSSGTGAMGGTTSTMDTPSSGTTSTAGSGATPAQ